ncbi:FadR/GntR family transcriptional regulator [Rubrobacter indicoceani]|uniref:FadR/GntR family transcriptional regulator n=1 Tax=Rubrobacter indicoceani TaxID=2051957 RepID=UPI000E5BC229|nr:FadR/GntR family transcriptional regulator [Rubrobacter indicoceani]
MKPIQRASLADVVSERILSLIEDGEYRAGDRLPSERELGEQLGVGRTSIREGLSYLDKLGVLDIHQGRGMVVRSFSLEDLFASPALVSGIVELPEKQIRNLMHTRRVLEQEAARLAAVSRTSGDLEQIREIIEAMKRSGGHPEQWFKLDRRFHVAVVTASDNSALIELVKLHWDLFSRFSRHSHVVRHIPLFVTNATRFHEQIYLAIAAADPIQAGEKMCVHLKNSEAIVLDRIEASEEEPPTLDYEPGTDEHEPHIKG